MPPHVRPPPKPMQARVWPGCSRPLSASSFSATGMLAALLAAGNLSFWLCDRALAALTRYYHVILKPKLKKKF